MYRLLIFLLMTAVIVTGAYGQEKIRIDENSVRLVKSPWEFQDISSKASLRGLHVLDEKNIWATGTDGTVIHTSDGGKTWRVIQLQGAEKLDIRDVHAIDDATVVLMTSGTPARIYRSTSAGQSWKLVAESTDERVFFDSMSFVDDRNGVIMGDPIDDRILVLRTADGGLTWGSVKHTPVAEPGEAGFAASGSNMTTLGKNKIVIALGGSAPEQPSTESRVVLTEDFLKTWSASSVPIPRNPSAGIFSICFANSKAGVAVGGDYQQVDSTEGNYGVTRNGGTSWTVPKKRQPPSGYRSCVARCIDGKEILFVTVGPNGTDLSRDLGTSWSRISNHGFHAVEFSPDGKFGWACGSDGRIAKWVGVR